MQQVQRFIQIFRYDLTEPDHDSFERVLINTNRIQMVEWHENWNFVTIVCETDHPDGIETYMEDYGDPLQARKRYGDIQTMLGANDGTAFDREKLMKKAAKENKKLDDWFHGLVQKAKAAGYDPFNDDEDEDEDENKSTDKPDVKAEPDAKADNGEWCDSDCENCIGGTKECCIGCAYEGNCRKTDKPEEAEREEAEVSQDGSETPAGSEGHLE